MTRKKTPSLARRSRIGFLTVAAATVLVVARGIRADGDFLSR